MSKKLPDRIYRDLSISQRIRAAWEAQNRDDTSELKKLTDPHEAGEYVIDRVSAAINDLETAGFAARIDLLSCLVSHLIETMKIGRTDDPDEKEAILENLNTHAAQGASIAATLDALAVEIGLPSESFRARFAATHPVLELFLEKSADRALPDLIEEYRTELLQFLGSRHPKIACFHPA